MISDYDVEPSANKVRVMNVTINRPASVSPGQWLSFWEARRQTVNHLVIHDEMEAAGAETINDFLHRYGFETPLNPRQARQLAHAVFRAMWPDPD